MQKHRKFDKELYAGKDTQCTSLVQNDMNQYTAAEISKSIKDRIKPVEKVSK